MSIVTVIAGGSGDIDEPDWGRLIPGPPDHEQGMPPEWREMAHREWLRLTAALRDAGTLGPENRHQVQRLVLAYVRYDFAAAQLFKLGAIVQARRTKVQQMNLWQTEMRAADSDATTAEMELGITPRRRGSVTKVQRKQKAASPADSYLKAVRK